MKQEHGGMCSFYSWLPANFFSLTGWIELYSASCTCEIKQPDWASCLSSNSLGKIKHEITTQTCHMTWARTGLCFFCLSTLLGTGLCCIPRFTILCGPGIKQKTQVRFIQMDCVIQSATPSTSDSGFQQCFNDQQEWLILTFLLFLLSCDCGNGLCVLIENMHNSATLNKSIMDCD